ncbi:MAG TPA: hypothetical protein DHV28_03380 [Ignavibacteriales bacterium]|nr:hypothetical protein [Ignavibacteriales bacterium]
MNKEISPIPANYFSTLNILFMSLLSGQVIYFIVGLFLIQSGNINGFGGMNTIFMFITPVVVLSSILASKFIYTKQVAEFDKSLPLENKLVSYRTASIIRLALLEGANIFNISIMIITTSYFFAGLFVIITTLFFFNRPTKEKFIMDYEVSSEDAIKIIS